MKCILLVGLVEKGLPLLLHYPNCTRQTPTLLMDKLFVKFVASGMLLLFGIVCILLLTVPTL